MGNGTIEVRQVEDWDSWAARPGGTSKSFRAHMGSELGWKRRYMHEWFIGPSQIRNSKPNSMVALITYIYVLMSLSDIAMKG